MKKIMAFFMVIVLSTTSYAYAKTYNVFSNGEILIEDKTLPNTEITYCILKNGKSVSDYDGTNALEIFVAYDETKSDEHGNYVIDFKTVCPSSKFPVIVAVEEIEEISNDEIYYVNKSENQNARNLLGSMDDVKQFLLDNVYALGINPDLLNEKTAAKAAELIKNSNYNFSTATFEDSAKLLNRVAAIASLCCGSIKLFSDYNEYFYIEKTISDWLNKEYLDESSYDDIEKMLSKKYSSVSDFERDLKTSILLVTVKKADGFGYTRDIIKDFGKDLGIIVNKLSEDVAINLTGKSYADINALNKDIENFYADGKNDNGSSNSSSGSSKKVGGGISSITVKGNEEADYEEISNVCQNNCKFNDLAGCEWAYEAINTLSSLGVINGKSDTVFAPNDLVLREEFVKISMRTANIANLYGEMKFTDVSKENWYYQDVKNAYLAGIVSGISSDRFGSGTAISREDMTVILYNLLLKKGVSLDKNCTVDFGDKSKISDYAKKAVEALASAGIVNGDEKMNFNPKDNATRAEAAKMVYGILAYIKR